MDSSNLFNVLLVEDSLEDALIFHKALKKLNIKWNLMEFNTGEEVLDYLKALLVNKNMEKLNKINLILLDLNLPGISGTEVLRSIKETKEFKKTPTVIMTTSLSKKDRENCYEYGANGYVCKPASFNDFLSMIDSINAYWLKTNTLPIMP